MSNEEEQTAPAVAEEAEEPAAPEVTEPAAPAEAEPAETTEAEPAVPTEAEPAVPTEAEPSDLELAKTETKELVPEPEHKEPEAKAPEVDKAVLKEQFEAFAKFGDKTADGKTIKLSQSDKWFKQAAVIEGKSMTTTDTGIAFRKVSKNAAKLSFLEWNKYLDEIAKNKKMDVNTIKDKLVHCGKPGFTGATSVSKTAALDRLTDTSKYGGTHRQRFDSTGKGKGKEGREEVGSKDGYVTGSKIHQKKDKPT